MLLEQGAAAHQGHRVDGGCPLSTAFVRLMWHGGGTSDSLAARAFDAVGSCIGSTSRAGGVDPYSSAR